jgi:hypothetical protein
MGEAARAVSLLDRAAAFGLPNYTLFRDDPHFRELHHHPRFKSLMTKLKREYQAYQTDFSAPD